MAKHTIGHAVMATEERYVLLRLTETLQLEMSRVYQVSGSPTQARDMAALVLFYAYAAMGAGTRYVGWAPLNARWMARARALVRMIGFREQLDTGLKLQILPFPCIEHHHFEFKAPKPSTFFPHSCPCSHPTQVSCELHE
jgi:hypothetical protein